MYVCMRFFLSGLKHHSIAYSSKIPKYTVQDGWKMADKVSKPANLRNENGITVFKNVSFALFILNPNFASFGCVVVDPIDHKQRWHS